MKKRMGKSRSIITMARKLTVFIYNMLEKRKELVEEHPFKTLKERKLKNMEAGLKLSRGFNRDEMETAIKKVGINSMPKKHLS
jgi:hypothetical protein